MPWKYFAQGNLNVLLISANGTEVLRLPKKSNKNSNRQIYENLALFKLFAKYLPRMSLVEVPNGSLSEHPDLNDHETHALLMENILYGMETTYRHPGGLIKWHVSPDKSRCVFEFKPKWLYKCTSINCRNCCLNKMKKRPETPCPLLLLSNTTKWVQKVFESFDVEPGLQWVPERLVKILEEDGIIELLYREQRGDEEFHSQLVGLNEEADVTTVLQRQMTLRDVTLFVSLCNLPDNAADETIKMVDLDLKPRNKFRHWKETELKLQVLYNDTALGGCRE